MTSALPRARGAEDAAACWVKVESLKNALPLAELPKSDQSKVLHALSDDMAEMAEIDMASSESSRAKYRHYFTSHLEFKALPGVTLDERLLFIRYHSNTVCGSDENCPVWIVSLTHANAHSMVPWQSELGTSAGGAWGIGIRQGSNAGYPELLMLTHLSSTQTKVACYRESKHHYLWEECLPECVRVLDHRP